MQAERANSAGLCCGDKKFCCLNDAKAAATCMGNDDKTKMCKQGSRPTRINLMEHICLKSIQMSLFQVAAGPSGSGSTTPKASPTPSAAGRTSLAAEAAAAAAAAALAAVAAKKWM